MVRVLFVCLGNICRSPLAQGIFEKKIEERRWTSKVFADSAGISGWHSGEKPHSLSIETARKYSVSIERQKSRPVSSLDDNEFDYFIAMDRSNELSLLNEFGIDKNKIYTMRSFGSQRKLDVPDPYGHGQDAFEKVFKILDESMEHFMEFLRKNHPQLN